MSDDNLENSEATITIHANADEYVKVLNQANNEALSKDDKLKIASLKKLNKYEDQFKKLGYKKEEAHQKAMGELQKKQLNQQVAEIGRMKAIKLGLNYSGEEKQSKISQFLNSRFWSQNLIGRALSQSLGNGISHGLGSVVHLGSQLLSTQDKLDRKNFFTDNLHNQEMIRKDNLLHINTGTSVDDIENIRYDILSALGKGTSGKKLDFESGNHILDLASKAKDPIYGFKNITNDLTGFLKGGGVDETGYFGNKFGQGKAIQMNALIRQQEDQVSNAEYRSMNDPELIKQRNDMINKLTYKGHAFESGEVVRSLRAIDDAKDETDMGSATVLHDKIRDIANKVTDKGLTSEVLEELIHNRVIQGLATLSSGLTAENAFKSLVNLFRPSDPVEKSKKNAKTSNQLHNDLKNNTKKSTAQHHHHKGKS